MHLYLQGLYYQVINHFGFDCYFFLFCVHCAGQKYCQHLNGEYVCFCYIDVCDVKPINDGQCDDINECDDNNGGCEQTCVNTDGSYHCECEVGFMLQPDGQHCVPGEPYCYLHCCKSCQSFYRNERLHMTYC